LWLNISLPLAGLIISRKVWLEHNIQPSWFRADTVWLIGRLYLLVPSSSNKDMELGNAPSQCKWGQWCLVMIFLAVWLSSLQAVDAGLGQWRLVTKNAGISAMHAAVAPISGTVVLLHHSNTGPSNITFPGVATWILC